MNRCFFLAVAALLATGTCPAAHAGESAAVLRVIPRQQEPAELESAAPEAAEKLPVAQEPVAREPAEPKQLVQPAASWQEEVRPGPFQETPADYFDDDLMPLQSISTSIAPPAGELPRDYAGPVFAARGEIFQVPGTVRSHTTFSYHWAAPKVVHRPLYFEQPNVEPHGYAWGKLQPALSAIHFYATIPALPYLMTAQSPHECVYDLGWYPPGNCAPYRLYFPEWDPAAAGVQASVVAGAILIIP